MRLWNEGKVLPQLLLCGILLSYCIMKYFDCILCILHFLVLVVYNNAHFKNTHLPKACKLVKSAKSTVIRYLKGTEKFITTVLLANTSLLHKGVGEYIIDCKIIRHINSSDTGISIKTG